MWFYISVKLKYVNELECDKTIDKMKFLIAEYVYLIRDDGFSESIKHWLNAITAHFQ